MQLLNAVGCILLAGCLSIDTVKALQCHKCTSEIDLECAVNLSLDTLLECDVTDTQCFTLKFNDNIIRGCESQIPKQCSENECSTKYCKSYGCNKDEPEPEPTLYCNQCSGDENCALGILLKPTLCENFAEEDECYTYVFSEGNVTRGCVSDKDSLCKNEEEFCVTCESYGCNKDLAFTTFSCHECQGNNKKCMGQSGDEDVCAVSSPTKCNVLLGRDGGCFTYYKLNELKRGCMQNFNESYDVEFTKICDKENCNSECVTNCYQCNSEDDPKCKSNLEEVQKKPCFGTTHCHECENEKGVIIRGCDKNNDAEQTCGQCSNDLFCNKKTSNKCINCSSDKDSDCILITDESKAKVKQCDSIFDECVSRIVDLNTVRGCTKQVGECSNPDSDICTSCKSDLCNKDMIPEDRLFCHHCNDNMDCAKKQKLENIAPCQNVSQILNSKCFSYKKNDQVIRGCSFDMTESEVCKNGDNACLYCNSRGCNSEIAETTSKCIVCNDGEECAWAQSADTAVECKFDFMEPSCFTQINDNKITKRGCMTRNDCNDPNLKCVTCSGEACNIKAVTSQTCIICDSTNDPNCVEGNRIPPTNCTAKETYFKNRGCYTIYEDEKIRRGCISELQETDTEECGKGNESLFCNVCREQGCNKGLAPVGGKIFKKCIECGPNDQECPWGHSEESVKSCVFARAHAACFSYQYGNGAVIRGCSNDKSVCDPNDEKCNICDEDACNNKNFVHQKCYQCVSNATNEATCASDNPNNIFVEKCSSDLQTFEDRGCYTRTQNKIVTRGCLMDLSDNERATCKADEKKEKCDFCMEAECNNKKAPNSGCLLTHFSFVSLIILSALITVKNHLE